VECSWGKLFWREKIACHLTKLCRNGKKTDQLLRDVIWLVPTGDHTLSRLELIQTQTEIYYFHINK
jgi:hypothetical protein